nr:MAG TPA: hypothetical protein [Caudoviricetes sp.]
MRKHTYNYSCGYYIYILIFLFRKGNMELPVPY